MNNKIFDFINVVKQIYKTDKFIPLHAPKFSKKESVYVNETISSTMVSSIGNFVDLFEEDLANYVNVPKAVATVNGTSGLQVALNLVGVKPGDEVITQSLTFVGTANAINLNFASPIFIDVDLDTLGMSPKSLFKFLKKNTFIKNGKCFNINTGKKISCCLPMHTFGFICRIEEIVEICKDFKIPVVEDAAEALGSFNNNKSAGTFGDIGVFSFNGNKIITTGGGGALISNNIDLMKKAKHLTTTAKKKHLWEFIHDDFGYNFRMPNINAALGKAQLEKIEKFKKNKKKTFEEYTKRLNSKDYIIKSIPNTTSDWNYWLFSLELKDIYERDEFLKNTNENKIMTRPIWKLIHNLPMYSNFYSDSQKNAKYLENRIINIPSSVNI